MTLAKSENRLGVFKRVSGMITEEGFSETEIPRWAYDRVASFFEDDWTDMLGYISLNPDHPIKTDDLGVIIYRLVGGCRYDKAHAEVLRYRWAGEGEWPTRIDAAAFIFYRYTEAPQRTSMP